MANIGTCADAATARVAVGPNFNFFLPSHGLVLLCKVTGCHAIS